MDQNLRPVKRDFRHWKIKRFCHLRCEDILFVFYSRYMYIALLISSFFIYAESVFIYYLFVPVYPPVYPLYMVKLAFSSLITYGYIFILYFILAFAYWAKNYQKKIIIEGIECDTDFSNNCSVGKESLQHLLAFELFHINKILRQVDNQRPISTTSSVIPRMDVAVSVDLDATFYDNLITESQLELGIIKIPIKAMIAFFGRFFEGKKIQGSAYCSNDEVVIVVSMKDDKRSLIWEVRGNPVKQNSRNQDDAYGSEESESNQIKDSILQKMIKELACRIFTDITPFNTFRWQAMSKYINGLEEYRSCLLTPKKQIVQLQKAERSFIEALAEDSSFGMAWYNLGVVYTELGFYDAADIAFQNCIEREENKWQAYYALALNLYNHNKKSKENLIKAGKWCDDAIALNKNKDDICKIPDFFKLKGKIYQEFFDYSNYKFGERCFKQISGFYRNGLMHYYLCGVKPYQRYICGLKSCLSYICGVKPCQRSYSKEDMKKADTERAMVDLIGDYGGIYLDYALCCQNCSISGDKQKNTKDLLDTAIYIYSQAFSSNPFTSDKGKSELVVDKSVSRCTASPFFLWNCGLLCLATRNDDRTEFFFNKALSIDPRTFFYHASRILFCALIDNQDDDKCKSYWREALTTALNAYQFDKKQWRFVHKLWLYYRVFVGDCVYPQEEKSDFESIKSEKNSSMNPFADELKIYDKLKNKQQTFLLTLYSLYEILKLIDDNEFVKTFDINSITDDTIISKVKEKIKNDLSPGNPEKINNDTILGFLSDHNLWIAGHFYCRIGRLLLENSDKESAKQAILAFKKAKNCFSDYPTELAFLGLEADQSKANLLLEYKGTAFFQSWHAHWRNPVRPHEHVYLARCEHGITDYRNAIKSLEEAQLWDPNYWAISGNIALMYRNLYDIGKNGPDSMTLRDKYIDRALSSLEKALLIAENDFQKLYELYELCELYELSGLYDKAENIKETIKETINGLIHLHLRIAIWYREKGDYFEAIYHLRIAKNLAAPCENTDKKQNELDLLLPVSYFLSEYLLKYGKFEEAYEEYLEILDREWIKPIHEKILNEDISFNNDLCKKCGSVLYLYGLNLREILHFTYLGIAQICIERLCDREEVEKWLGYAETLVTIKSDNSCCTGEFNEKSENEYRGEIQKIRGLLYLKGTFKAIKLNKAIKSDEVTKSVELFSFYVEVLRSSVCTFESFVKALSSYVEAIKSDDALKSVELLNTSVEVLRSSVCTFSSSVKTLKPDVTLKSLVETLNSLVELLKSVKVLKPDEILSSSIDLLKPIADCSSYSVDDLNSYIEELNSVAPPSSFVKVIESFVKVIDSSVKTLSASGETDNITNSIEFLQDSIRLSGDPESYVYLLMALYQNILNQETTDKKILPDLYRFNNRYQTLENIGIPKEYKTIVEEMNNKIKEITPALVPSKNT